MSRLRERGWIVGERMPSNPRSLPANDQRSARLEARLSLYAQYAALLGAEMTSAWSADPAQAGALTRELARARAELAERYDELRGMPDDGTSLVPEQFGEVFADAVLEMDQQRLLDQALRAKAETLRPDMSGGLPRLLPGLPAPDGAGLAVEPAFEVLDVPAEPAAASEDGLASLGGALVAARSSGVGGVLGGQFPGVVAGVGAMSEETPAVEGARLDVRF